MVRIRRSWTTDEDNLLRQYYPIKKGIQMLNNEILSYRSYASIKRRAHRLGLINKNFWKDENFFNEPNTLNSSIAGIIASDGHITNNRVSIYQRSSEDKMLMDILEVTKSNYNIYRRKRYGNDICFSDNYQSSLDFYRASKWVKNLNNIWNIPIGHKSYSIEPPVALSTLDYKLAYICGLISGDGTICKSVTKKKYEKFNLCVRGTLSLVMWCKNVFSEFLQQNLNIKITKERKTRSLYYFQVSDFKAIDIFEKIRSLECVFLDKKWNNLELLSLIERKKSSIYYSAYLRQRNLLRI